MNHFLPSHDLTGWRKSLAGFLRRLGPTWRAVPLRRVIQILSLALFFTLFFYVAWPYADVFDASVLPSKEFLPAELYLLLDPLVALSAAVAARALMFALVWMAGVLVVNLVVPRGFCGYLCPLGTLIDLFDWLVGNRVSLLKLERRGWWIHLRYYLLAIVAASSVSGVLLSGYFSAIPVLNRGLRLSLGSVQLGLLRGWDALPPLDWTSYAAVAMFAAVFLLGLLRKRFWCRYVCPTGALFSLASLLRVTERRVVRTTEGPDRPGKVKSSCTDCGRCVRDCPFDAIKPDFTARALDCTTCQTCGGVCPTRAIRFAWRWSDQDLKVVSEPARGEISISRRAFVASAAGGVAAALTMRAWPGDVFRRRGAPLRPPGSVAEEKFLDLCVRCGECMKVCPGPVLHPAGIAGGLEALWTPVVVPTWAGCHQDCNFCTQVCPTGAIRPLAMEEKRKTRMGLAKIDTATCLPHVGTEECRICFETCEAAGYNAVEFREIELKLGEIPEGVFSEMELEAMSHIMAPFVVHGHCVGCGQCENRCHAMNVERHAKLPCSAVVISPENADRPS